MTRLVLVATLLAASLSSTPRAQVPPTAPVVIDAVVVDANGVPVTDLTAKDLEVWIGGYRVPIEKLTAVTPSNERAGRTVVLVLDDLLLHPSLTPRVREVARRFVDRMLPGDAMGITTFNGGTFEMTGDRTALFRIIDDYNVGTVGVQRIDYYGERVLAITGGISRHLAEPQDRRKTIVAIGAAAIFDTPIPPPQVGRELRQEWTDAMRSLAFSNTVFYVIEPAGLGGMPLLPNDAGFSRETGGTAFANTNDFEGAVDRILREASSYYILEVADPPIRRRAALRELEVRVLRPGLKVRTRRVLPGTEATIKGTPTAR